MGEGNKCYFPYFPSIQINIKLLMRMEKYFMNYPLNYYDEQTDEISIMHQNFVTRINVLHVEFSSKWDSQIIFGELIDSWYYTPYETEYKYVVFAVSHGMTKSINNSYFTEKVKEANKIYIEMVKESL